MNDVLVSRRYGADRIEWKDPGIGPIRPFLATAAAVQLKVYQQLSRRDYCGDFIYADGRLERMLHEAGWMNPDGGHTAQICDWQGNVRATWTQGDVEIGSGSTGPTTLKRYDNLTAYYPYGLPFSDWQGTDRYLYSGKELERADGLQLYDFHARLYDPQLAHFHIPDPLATQTPATSPYLYCAANPIAFIDPTGEDVVILNYGYTLFQQHLAMLIQDEDKQWKYYSINGDNVYDSSGNHSGGRAFNDVGVGSWRSPQEFLDSEYNQRTENTKDNKSRNHFGYSEGYQITTSPKQDEQMRAEFEQISTTEYKLFGNNCATAVQKVLFDAGITVASPKYEKIHVPANKYLGEPEYNILRPNFSPFPSKAFESIIKNNPGGTHWKKNGTNKRKH